MNAVAVEVAIPLVKVTVSEFVWKGIISPSLSTLSSFVEDKVGGRLQHLWRRSVKGLGPDDKVISRSKNSEKDKEERAGAVQRDKLVAEEYRR